MPEHHTSPPASGPLLRQVRLQNFKSVHQQDVQLGQLTLLVGENSSGKSSILQALRLLQQAARAASPGDAFPLNGELISVGTIDDLRSAQADTTDTVAIGVEFSSSEFPRLPWLRRSVRSFMARQQEPRGDASLTWRVRLADTAPDEPGSARIRELLLSAEDPLDERRLTLCLERSAPQEAASALPSGYSWSDYVDCDLALRGALHNEDLSGADSDKRVQIVGGALAGALPSALVTEQPADRALATIWTHRFIDYLHSPAAEPGPSDRDEVPPALDGPTDPVDGLDDTAEFAVAAIARLVEDFGDTSTVLRQRTLDGRYFPEPSEFFVHEYEVIWQGFGPYEDEFDWVVSRLIDAITERLVTDARLPLLAEEREWQGLASFAEHFEGYMNRRVRYLGPLRAAPAIVMPTSASARTGDIGNSGEYTAAVLRSHGAKRVEVPMPDGSRRIVALGDAVDAWATHLGLVDGVTVSDLPGIGLAVTVRPRGLGKDLSLPSVGVGVSQLIPVLVLCLLAEPGNLILLEQPELHLHPGLQQRLTDFFVAIAGSGRQLIVETHSEYFVSRIRRRIAADPGGGTRSLTKIVFAERDPDTGITEYRDIDLSPYGDIDNWPQGFFDQAAEEEREILRAGLQKRALHETQAPNNSDPNDG